MNIVELMASEEEQSVSPCKFGNIVGGHACYCHNDSEGMPRKCPIWRSYGTGDLSKWRREPWQEADYQTRRLSYRRFKGKEIRVEIAELGPVWPDEGCPCFEPSSVADRVAHFHDHLDKCDQCRNHPFALCQEGARRLIESAANM